MRFVHVVTCKISPAVLCQHMTGIQVRLFWSFKGTFLAQTTLVRVNNLVNKPCVHGV